MFYKLKIMFHNIRLTMKDRSELTVSRRWLLTDMYTGGIVNNLIGGNFFIGLLILLNADDAFIGLVTMVGLLGNILQILSPVFLEKFPQRKKILILSRAVIWILNIIIIGIIPFFGYDNELKLLFVIVVIFLINFINAFTAPGFPVWHIKSVPENIRSKFFSLFHYFNGLIIYTVILLASNYVDSVKAAGMELHGLTVLRVIALAIAIFNLRALWSIKEFPNEPNKEKLTFKSLFIDSFKEKLYMMTVLIACLWSFSANTVGAFYTVYLLKDLEISYSFLTIVNMISIPANLISIPLWKKIVDKKSWFTTLKLSMLFYSFHYVLLALVTSKTIFIYPIAITWAFLIGPGINLVFSNIPYINIPQRQQTKFIGMYSAMQSVAAFVGVTYAREFIRLTDKAGFSFFGLLFENKQLLVISTSVIMLICVMIIGKIVRIQEKQKKS